jgi:hypothetical protein
MFTCNIEIMMRRHLRHMRYFEKFVQGNPMQIFIKEYRGMKRYSSIVWFNYLRILDFRKEFFAPLNLSLSFPLLCLFGI